MSRKVLLGCGAGASGVGALALGVVAVTLGAVGSCGGDAGQSLVAHDTSSGSGTVVGEGINLLGATAEGAAVLAAVAGGALLVLAGLLLWLALRRVGAPPSPS